MARPPCHHYGELPDPDESDGAEPQLPSPPSPPAHGAHPLAPLASPGKKPNDDNEEESACVERAEGGDGAEGSAAPTSCSRLRAAASVLVAAVLLWLVAGLPTAVLKSHHRGQLQDFWSRHWDGDLSSWERRVQDVVALLRVRQYRAAKVLLVPGARQRAPHEPYCLTNSDLFPGKVHNPTGDLDRAVWEPNRACRIEHFSEATALSCLRGLNKTFAFFGDSLLDGAAIALGAKAGLRKEVYRKEIVGDMKSRYNLAWFLPGAGGPDPQPISSFYWTTSAFLMDPADSSLRPNASRAFYQADVLVLHHGLWDMSLTCRGIFAFYHSLKERILQLQAAAKPGAEVVLFDLHYLYLGKCVLTYGMGGKCYRWNRLDKAQHYREAIRLAASCTGVGLYSNLGVYKAMPNYTTDGLHYEEPPVLNMEADIFLNHFCPRGDGAPPMSFIQPGFFGCDERAAFRRWSQNPRSLYCPRQIDYMWP